MVHRNFQQTEDMVINLLEMDSRLDSIEEMLAIDRSDLVRPAVNLLPIHLQLTQLENFRNETMHQAKKASAESRNKLARRFERLTGVIEAFNEYIVELSQNILPLARSGHLDVIVKIVKIAEVEGKEDEKVIFYKSFGPFRAYFFIGTCDPFSQKSSQTGRGIQV
jgi:exocyst complex component 3